MQILARIPVLSPVAASPDRCVATPPPSSESPAGMAVSSASEADDPPVEPSAAALVPHEPKSSLERPRAGLPAPSILVLSLLAVAMWAAALRNDRLRLETARQARAARLAQVEPGAIGAEGSRTR